jgi:ABC-2 type transport system ATP-binding protein
LDPIGRKEIRDLIARLKQEGKTVFFNTHILSDVEVICDRVGIIHLGRLLKVGPVKELSSATIQSWEIQAEVRGEELKKDLEAREMRGEISISWQGEQALVRIADEEKAQALVKMILEKGGHLTEYFVHRQNLEDYFWKAVAASGEK